jgi:hypothetical protein
MWLEKEGKVLMVASKERGPKNVIEEKWNCKSGKTC